jgi:hypothetical protein
LQLPRVDVSTALEDARHTCTAWPSGRNEPTWASQSLGDDRDSPQQQKHMAPRDTASVTRS